MNKNITFKGRPVEVTFKGIEIGSKFPNFKAVNKDMTDFNLADYAGKIIVVNAFPSVDTGICAMQTVRFNQEVKNYEDLVVVTVSKDLPFTLNRFCADKDVNNAITVSDYRYRDFENNVGGLIKDIELLARQVIVLDKSGQVKYLELCDEVSSEPNFEAALAVIKELV
ncbi:MULTISPECIES: thiol peroxidase [unclassified Gemella]|uniref:thiol peroxidase n=1 Tax=unclassified Gemella TaxID=2624949 RepID=UPI001C04479A|nr:MULTISPECIES: thiol peroxidase [unclassified Gemella]MBU0278575.1 thiol peroxidase [Gemella sp. zg-1178]QWQ38299.1 thiol peroxidase [Gemella sp. zg-570]